jgi:molybdopterin synthase catalytic subunit
MAENQIQAILKNLAGKYPCTSAEVIHRLGTVPVGETSLFVRVRAPHRSEAFQLLTSFLDRLKQDVPIWKTQP